MKRKGRKKEEGECRRCGRCCQSMVFWIDRANSADGWDHLEWARLHTPEEIVFEYDEHGNRWWGIELPIPCRELEQDSDGLYRCRIYERRPQMCREYSGKHFNPDCGLP